MRRLNGTRSIFEEGNAAFYRGDFEWAKSMFLIASHDLEYREKAMCMLYKIYLKIGMYRAVREGLENDEIKDDKHRISLYAFLDNYEYNYDRSLRCYNYLISKGYDEYLFNRASVNMNLGNFSKAFSDIQGSSFNTKETIRKELFLVRLYLLEEKFDKALNILNSINKKNLSKDYKKLYEKLRILTLYNLGRDAKGFVSNKSTWYVSRILSDDEEAINERISRKRLGKVRFSDNVNINLLKEEASKLIREVNPSVLVSLNVYRGLLDYPLGLSNGREIKGLSVSTLIGTDKLNSIFPVDFSDEFDIEGYSKSEKLSRKLNLR